MATVIRGAIECSRPDGTRTVLVDGRPLGALATKGAGTFRARLFLIGGPPDNDGDVIYDPCEGRRIHLSVKEHDLIYDPTLEPAGEAILRQEGNAVVAEGRAFDTERGHRLREHLVAKGHRSEWSVGFVVTDGRDPTADQRRAWPDVKRVIYGWDVFEASVVTRGACGPSCRTLEAKTKSCGCSDAAPLDLAAVQATLDRARFVIALGEWRDRDHWFLVDAARQELAAKALAFASQRLHLPLSLKWRHIDNAWGFFRPDEPGVVNVDPDAPLERIAEIVFHEAQHAKDHGAGLTPYEESAEVVARRLLENWHRENAA